MPAAAPGLRSTNSRYCTQLHTAYLCISDSRGGCPRPRRSMTGRRWPPGTWVLMVVVVMVVMVVVVVGPLWALLPSHWGRWALLPCHWGSWALLLRG